MKTILLALLPLGLVAQGAQNIPHLTFKVVPVTQEHARGFLGMPKGWRSAVKWNRPYHLGVTQLPPSFDWRKSAPVAWPAVKDQGNCGSCWAVASTSAFEGAIAAFHKKNGSLSAQQTLSCSGAGTCDGGYFPQDYFVKPGLAKDSAFPYRAADLPCPTGLKHESWAKSWAFVGSSDVKAPSVDDIKAAIYQYGPVAAAVAADWNFESYGGGVFNLCDSNAPLNHMVVLLGWDDATGSWILQNSWGTGWGEGGFMRIQYGCNSVGAVAAYTTLPKP